ESRDTDSIGEDIPQDRPPGESADGAEQDRREALLALEGVQDRGDLPGTVHLPVDNLQSVSLAEKVEAVAEVHHQGSTWPAVLAVIIPYSSGLRSRNMVCF